MDQVRYVADDSVDDYQILRDCEGDGNLCEDVVAVDLLRLGDDVGYCFALFGDGDEAVILDRYGVRIDGLIIYCSVSILVERTSELGRVVGEAYCSVAVFVFVFPDDLGFEVSDAVGFCLAVLGGLYVDVPRGATDFVVYVFDRMYERVCRLDLFIYVYCDLIDDYYWDRIFGFEDCMSVVRACLCVFDLFCLTRYIGVVGGGYRIADILDYGLDAIGEGADFSEVDLT